MKPFDYNKYIKNNPLLKEANLQDLLKPLTSKLESMGYQVDYDRSFGFLYLEAFKTLPDGSILRMALQPSDKELQQKGYNAPTEESTTIDVDFTHWTTQVTKKLFGLYKQKTRVMNRLPDDEGNNIDLGVGMFDIPVEQSVDRVINLVKKAEAKVSGGTPTRQFTGNADADFMGEEKSSTEELNEFDITSFFQGQLIQQAMQGAPQAMTEADKIITYVLMSMGIGTIAGGLAAIAKDELGSLNPIPAIKQWWANRQKRKALEPIVAKLKKDPEVMKYVANRNMRGIQTVIKSKLSPEEQKYIGSLTRDALSESSLNKTTNFQ